jgi:hypothetical protein
MSKNISIVATGQAHTGKGSISGFVVSSHSSGTLKLVDAPNSAVGRVLMPTWTLATGPQVVTFPKPLDFYEGVHATV